MVVFNENNQGNQQGNNRPQRRRNPARPAYSHRFDTGQRPRGLLYYPIARAEFEINDTMQRSWAEPRGFDYPAHFNSRREYLDSVHGEEYYSVRYFRLRDNMHNVDILFNQLNLNADFEQRLEQHSRNLLAARGRGYFINIDEARQYINQLGRYYDRLATEFNRQSNTYLGFFEQIGDVNEAMQYAPREEDNNQEQQDNQEPQMT